MFYLIKPGTTINFVKAAKVAVPMSVIVIVATLVGLVTHGLNYGIDFAGGAEVQVKFIKDAQIGQVREALDKGGLGEFRLQNIGDDSQNEFLVRVRGDESTINQISGKISEILSKSGLGEFQILKSDIVGAAAGSTLKTKGVLAMFYAMLLILCYVFFRFDSRYAPGAIMALVHDSVFVLGIFLVTQKQFDLTILAALLALIGYSNNDTIIVYDRVREEMHLHPEYSVERTVNLAINETLGRTIVTSMTTFIVATCLYLFGGTAIENFAFTFMVGIAIGTYSSIFIASAFVVIMARFQMKRQASASKRPAKKKKEYHVRPNPT